MEGKNMKKVSIGVALVVSALVVGCQLLLNRPLCLLWQLGQKIETFAPQFRRSRGIALKIAAKVKKRFHPDGAGFRRQAGIAENKFRVAEIDALVHFTAAGAFHTHSPAAFFLQDGFARPFAQIADDTFFATWLARQASVAPVQNKPMVRVTLELRRDRRFQFLLNLEGILAGR